VKFEVDAQALDECLRKGVPPPKLPDPSLIAIRAAVARVAHMSGAAEHRDALWRDEEEIEVLASDGSNADFLRSRLSILVSNAA
jgi:hypothetical protein